MNRKQYNFVEALESTHAFLSTQPALVALAAMPPLMEKLNTCLERIRAAAHLQGQPVRRAVEDRDAAAATAIESTLAVAGALRSYASANENPSLY